MCSLLIWARCGLGSSWTTKPLLLSVRHYTDFAKAFLKTGLVCKELLGNVVYDGVVSIARAVVRLAPRVATSSH